MLPTEFEVEDREIWTPYLVKYLTEIDNEAIKAALSKKNYDQLLVIQKGIVERFERAKAIGVVKEDEVLNAIASLSWYAVLARKFDVALNSAESALRGGENAEIKFTAMTNRAHALMLLNRLDEAREAYRAGQGKTNKDQKTWETVILDDFKELKDAGLSHQLMDEIANNYKKTN